MDNNKLTKTEERQPLKTLLPQLYNSQKTLRETGLLEQAPKSIQLAVQSDSPALSVLKRECGKDIVKVAVGVVLKEMFSLTLSPAASNAPAIASMAGMIIENFYFLKFDEIVFAINKGINAGYTGEAGKHFGHINYQQISEWLNAYNIESAQVIADLRDAQHEKYKSPHFANEYMSALPPETIRMIGEKSERDSRNGNKREMSWNEVNEAMEDNSKFIQVEKHGKNFKTKRLLELETEAQEKKWERTLAVVRKELETRITFSIKSLAGKIASGNVDFTPEELQIQANHPMELEMELKRVNNNPKQ